MTFFSNFYSKGFTVTEILVYIAIFALMMTGVLAGIAAILESANRDTLRAQLETDGTFLIEKIDWLIQENDLLNPDVYKESSSLELVSRTGEKISISSADGVITIQRGTSIPLPLTDTNIKTDSLLFTREGTPGSSTDPEHVDLTLTLTTQPSRGPAITEQFRQTVYLSVQ